jgi:hypothetical protein
MDEVEQGLVVQDFCIKGWGNKKITAQLQISFTILLSPTRRSTDGSDRSKMAISHVMTIFALLGPWKH